MAMTYGNVYVAQVAMGANDEQTLKAFLRGRGLRRPVADHRLQPLHRPRQRHGTAWSSRRRRSSRATGRCTATTRTLAGQGKNPFQLDSRAPTSPLEEYIYTETRYTMLAKSDPMKPHASWAWPRKMSPPAGSSTSTCRTRR